MSRYFCIFQTRTTKEISKDVSKTVKTVSITLNDPNKLGYNQCSGHGFCTSNKNGALHEGKNVIQDNCVGHTLKRSNLNIENNFKKKYIKHESYNNILQYLTDEITTRLQSPLYSKYKYNFENRLPDKINSKEILNANNINNFKKILNLNELYLDTVKKPSFLTVNTRDIAKNELFKQYTNLISKIVSDCICYSDCNGYSVCNCYGNCNHY